MISVVAWLILITAITALACAIWRDHVSRMNSGALVWFTPEQTNARSTFVSLAVAIALWQVASDLAGNPTVLPEPVAALHALWELTRWELLVNVLITLRRIGIAFTIATLIGVGIGLAAGLFPWIGRIVLPLNSALRYIPPTAFIGLTIVWFGVQEGSKLALIVIAILFYIIQMTVDVTRAFPRGFAEVALNLGATDWETFVRVIFPHCVPELLKVLRVNMGAAWTFVVVAEIVSGQDGLGHLLAVSQRFLATPQLFALLFLVGVLGYLSDLVFTVAIRFTSPWK